MTHQQLMTGADTYLARAEGHLDNALNDVMAYGMVDAERYAMARAIRDALGLVRMQIAYRSQLGNHP